MCHRVRQIRPPSCFVPSSHIPSVILGRKPGREAIFLVPVRAAGEISRMSVIVSASHPDFWGDFPDRIVPPYTFARFGAKSVQGVCRPWCIGVIRCDPVNANLQYKPQRACLRARGLTGMTSVHQSQSDAVVFSPK